jgi:hypothetical protein
LNLKTSTDLSSVTFSAGLRAGLTHSGWLIGPTKDPSGQEAAHVSHSVLPERVEELTTSVTFGQLFGGSSPSEDLQSFLANRLRRQMGDNGSVEYELTWKQWDMQSGPPICALRASGHRTSGSGFSGWPTCSSRDWKDTPEMADEGTNPDGSKRSRLDQLARVAHLTGWPTPRAITGGPESAERKQELGRTQSGGGDLQATAQTVGWQTPSATDGERSGTITPNMTGQSLTQMARGAIPSSSPAPMESGEGCPVSGWGTPTDQDAKHSSYSESEQKRDPNVLRNQVYKAGDPTLKLNPRFSLWLQGYPIEWAFCGERVTR